MFMCIQDFFSLSSNRAKVVFIIITDKHKNISHHHFSAALTVSSCFIDMNVEMSVKIDKEASYRCFCKLLCDFSASVFWTSVSFSLISRLIFSNNDMNFAYVVMYCLPIGERDVEAFIIFRYVNSPSDEKLLNSFLLFMNSCKQVLK